MAGAIPKKISRTLMKILIMGLPGSGKTYLTERLVPLIGAAWFNADKVREMANDWDFSEEGRVRQSNRMKSIADFENNHGRLVVCDFVCPTVKTRQMFDADFTVWMDTIKESNYKDTDKIFEEPENFNLKISQWNQYSPKEIADLIQDV